jgi:hypothetical protein
MPAIHIPAAQQIQANKAGQTSAGMHKPTAAPVSPTEAVTGFFHQAGGDLSSLLAGGSHPENPFAFDVPVDVAKATASINGRIGGLTPTPSTSQVPGPAGRAAAAAGNARAALERLVR